MNATAGPLSVKSIVVTGGKSGLTRAITPRVTADGSSVVAPGRTS
jgi:NAD(P)-dependent dehydrogenase (short-subunit alcohol dehydrogenase family)